MMKKSIVQSRKLSTALTALTAAVFCAMLAGCNVGPKYIPPAMTAPPAFKESPDTVQGGGRMGRRAAPGCGSSRQVVGDLQ